MAASGAVPARGPGTAPTAVRRRILAMLAGFSLISYVLRMNISIAQQYMVPELGLSEIQIGQVFSAFMLGYALFQIPAGVWGDRRGPKRVLAVAAITWGISTLLTGLVPGVWIRSAAAVFVSLLLLRFLLGVSEAATYPLAARTLANWMPAREHAFSNAIVIGGATLGSACTPPLIAAIMQSFGWRAAFYATAILPVALALVWWWKAADRPEEHPAVNREELALITGGRVSTASQAEAGGWWPLVRNRNVAFLCGSYFLDSYVMFLFVFWLFRYLVEVRKFSIMGGGWASSLPFAAATVALPCLGHLSDRWSLRLTPLAGRRRVAMSCLAASGLLLWAGAAASQAAIALTAISLSVAFLFSTEGPYWATAIDLAGPHAGASGGLMNMAGNLGGVVSTSLVPVLAHYFGWMAAFGIGSALALVSAALWMGIRPRDAIQAALARSG